MQESSEEAIVNELRPNTNILMFIHIMMMAGVLAYFLFVWSRGLSVGGDKATLPVASLSLAVVSLVMSFVIPALIRRSGVGAEAMTPQSLASTFTVSHIVAIALLEGAAFFAVFSLANPDNPAPAWYWIVAVGLLVVMGVRFPFPGRLTNWVLAQMQEAGLGTQVRDSDSRA
jgi:hypothetical protein